jgi:hypothetical protein
MPSHNRRHVLGLSAGFLAALAGCSTINGGSPTETPSPSLVIQWLDITNGTQESPTVTFQLHKNDTEVLSDSLEMDPVEGRETSLIRREVPESERSPGQWELTAEIAALDEHVHYRPESSDVSEEGEEYFLNLEYGRGIGLHATLLSPSMFE